MFNKTHKGYSTVKQNTLGDCYYLASLILLDSRAGALEKLFVTKEVNEAGIYAMRLFNNGEEQVVYVDDYVPTYKTYRFGRHDYFPMFASSTVEGEIWPMIAEKIWAKLVGSYGNAESGGVHWALGHLTNDPTQ